MVVEEVMMQRWLLWSGTFDDGGGNYARPQHMKVLNHFLYIQYGHAMQSGMVYSLNQDTTAHLGSALPIFFKIWPPPAHVSLTCTCITV